MNIDLRMVRSPVALALAVILCLTLPAKSQAQGDGILHASYSFRLTRCSDPSICNAFLKLLETTKFKFPPYCGIPESDSVPGFEKLHRVPLSEANIVTLFPKVFSFTYKQNQDIVPLEATNAEIENYIKVGAIRAWKYVPWISLKNDGKTDDVVVWQGSGVYPGLSGNARCGEVNEVMDPPDGARTEQIIFVLSGEGNAIDEQETRRLFGNPGPPSLYIRAFKGVDGVSPFGPLGHEMGLMKYKGTSYIYVFGAAAQSSQISKSDQAEKRIWSEALNTLSLYRWVGDANREVARYAMTVTH